MKDVMGLSYSRMREHFRDWGRGELASYLVGITADILGATDRETGLPILELIQDRAGQKGTGKWINLGRDYGKALAEYGRLVAGSNPRSPTMADLIDRYMREVAPTKAAATYRDNIRQSKLLRAFFGQRQWDRRQWGYAANNQA